MPDCFSDFVRQRRQELGQTQRQVAQACCVTPEMITLIEAGRRLVVFPDGTIGCLYEKSDLLKADQKAKLGGNYNTTITFVRFPLGWLTAGAEEPSRK